MSDLVEAFKRYFEVVHATTDELREQVFRLRYQVYCIETRFEDAAHFPQEMERDVFDALSTHALLRHCATGWWAGTVRLVLPDSNNPDNPYPVEQSCGPVFAPEKLGSIEFPRASTGEVSRFAVSKEFRRRHAEYLSPSGVSTDIDYDRRVYSRRRRQPPVGTPSQDDRRSGTDKRCKADRRTHDEERQVVPHITLGLIQALVAMSADQGVSHWCAAMEPTLLRLLTRLGIYFQHIGMLIEYHGKRQPCVANLDTLLLGVKRQRYDVWEVLTDRGLLWPGTLPAQRGGRQKLRTSGEEIDNFIP